MFVCVLSTQRTILLPFTKEYSVAIGSISNQRRQQILRSPYRILRSLPMDNCHFAYISKLTKKETLECWELDFLCYPHKPMLSYYWTVCCANFLVYTLSQGWVDSPHDNNSVAIALLQSLPYSFSCT